MQSASPDRSGESARPLAQSFVILSVAYVRLLSRFRSSQSAHATLRLWQEGHQPFAGQHHTVDDFLGSSRCSTPACPAARLNFLAVSRWRALRISHSHPVSSFCAHRASIVEIDRAGLLTLTMLFASAANWTTVTDESFASSTIVRCTSPCQTNRGRDREKLIFQVLHGG